MPFPDSEYPSILRGRDKRESQRLMAAAPNLIDALANASHELWECSVMLRRHGIEPKPETLEAIRCADSAIAKAEGRE
jgi:hypothetical protein